MKRAINAIKVMYSYVTLFLVVLIPFSTVTFAQQQSYLERSADAVKPVKMEISTETAHYKPLFGSGDSNADMAKGVHKYGLLTLNSRGESQLVDYGREEVVYYVLEGTGTLNYRDKEVPITKDDFFYVPINTEHGFSNPREGRLQLMVMGYDVPTGVEVESDVGLQLANAREVEFQTLEQNNHGPTSRFRLLLGTTKSKRDRLAAANQILSLYVIDFDHGGTNIPHRHEKAEEIYFMLQGNGEMVAGENSEGEPRRISVDAGDAFFFSRNSLVGFYSGTEKGEEHARILAIRSIYSEEDLSSQQSEE